MVQVIYPFKQNKYPFGRGKQSQHTYMQYILRAKDQTQTTKYRQLNSMMKKLSHPNIMRLQRVLKEQMAFHMLYQFHNKSLQKHLKQLQKQQELATIFVELENVFDVLIERRLKAQLYLDYMGVDDGKRLKVWMKPDEIEYMGQLDPLTEKKVRKMLQDYYQTERTRIHLEIQEVFQESENGKSKNNSSESEEKKGDHSFDSSKGKQRNFVIEGNTLVFLDTSSEKQKGSVKSSQHEDNGSEKHFMSKANHVVYEDRPISKTVNSKRSQHEQPTYQPPDLSKMSVAQKVLYYKKQKQQNSSQMSSNSHQNHQLIIKDSSTSNASQNDISKSSNNDSNMQIKTEMIAKNKMKIITSQEVQVQGDSDDDLQRLAREKIAKLNHQRQQKSHNQDSFNQHNKTNNSASSEHVQKFLKGLDENTRQQYQEHHHQQSKQINTKITQAKLKAKNILDKYCDKIKK